MVVADHLGHKHVIDVPAFGGKGRFPFTGTYDGIDAGNQFGRKVVPVIEEDTEVRQSHIRSFSAKERRKRDCIPYEFVPRERQVRKLKVALREINPVELEGAMESQPVRGCSDGIFGADGNQGEEPGREGKA